MGQPGPQGNSLTLLLQSGEWGVMAGGGVCTGQPVDASRTKCRDPVEAPADRLRRDRMGL